MSRVISVAVAVVLAIVVTLFVNHFGKQEVAQQVASQISFAKQQHLCYTPIIPPQVRTFDAAAVIRRAASNHGWQISSEDQFLITVTDPNCKVESKS